MIRLSRLSTREARTFIFKSTFVPMRCFLFFFVTPTVCCVFLNDIKKNIKKEINENEKWRKSERRVSR